MKVNNPSEVNLNKCKEGDILISKNGRKFTYSKKLDPEVAYYDHLILNEVGAKCTRVNSGHVMKK